MQRSCSVGICSESVSLDRLMCLEHWRVVPQNLQREVWGAWRAFQKAQGVDALERDLAAVLSAMKRLRAAQDAAVSYVEMRLHVRDATPEEAIELGRRLVREAIASAMAAGGR